MENRIRETAEVECDCCHNKFQKPLFRIKEAKKLYIYTFCSKGCRDKFKIKSLTLKCTKCSKDIVVGKSVYDKSASKRFFCNKSCAAKYNNVIKGKKSEDEKDKIRDGLIKYYKSKGIIAGIKKECLTCGKHFKVVKGKNKICCSKRCSSIYNFGASPYTKEDVVNTILKIKEETGLTPQIRDCSRRLEYAAVRFFGTWNKVMKECGLKPNHSKYQKIRLTCKDGHVADSISEKIIDEWLFAKGVKHEKNKKYPNSNRDCDFYLNDSDTWVEYFGLSGGNIEEYEIGILEKRKIALNNGFKFIEITPKDLYEDEEDYDKVLERIIRL